MKKKIVESWIGFCLGGLYALMWLINSDLAIVMTAGMIVGWIVWLKPPTS
jgi:hypothetical protein